MESRVPIQSRSDRFEKGGGFLVGQYILIQGNDALDQNFLTFAYCYAIQNSSKNSAEK